MSPKEHVAAIDAEIERLKARGKEKHGNEEHFGDHLERHRATRRMWLAWYPEAA